MYQPIYEVKSNFITVEFTTEYEKALEAFNASQARDKAIWLIPVAGFKKRIL